jgi:type III secretion protein Q
MSDAPESAPAEVPAARIGDLEVPVRFDLGTAPTTIGVLETMQAGYVFELNRNVADPVTISVNGVLLGRGELVRVGDKLGVRVVEVTSDASIHA